VRLVVLVAKDELVLVAVGEVELRATLRAISSIATSQVLETFRIVDIAPSTDASVIAALCGVTPRAAARRGMLGDRPCASDDPDDASIYPTARSTCVVSSTHTTSATMRLRKRRISGFDEV
jgi:hypothetical protein